MAFLRFENASAVRLRSRLLLSVGVLVVSLGVGAAKIADAAEVVGAVGATNAGTTGRAPSAAPRTLKPGDDVFFKDHIATKRGGSAQIMFLDRSTLNVGENSDVVIDEFVYKPGEAGTMRAKLNKGFLRYVGGDISHSGGASVSTPTVTIGIRGGIGMIGSIKDATAIASMPGVPRDFKSGTFVVNGYGTMTVSNASSSMVISRPGFAVFVASSTGAISAPVRFDMAAAKAMMRTLGSRSGQTGGAPASARSLASAVTATAVQSFDVPVTRTPPVLVNGLDYSAVFSAGNALTRNRSQAQQATAAAAIRRAATPVPAPVVTSPVMAPPVVVPVAATPVATPVAVTTVVTPVVTSPATTTPVATPVVAPPVVTTPVITPVVTPPVTTTPVVTPVIAPPATTTPVITPVVTPPVAITPVVTPVVTPPVVTTPVITPVVTPPVATTPVVTPVVTPPVATTPVVVPVVTPPVVTTPVITPVVTPPVVTTPVVTPVVTPPVVTTPVITPVVTPPVVTTPVVTPVVAPPVVTTPVATPVGAPPVVTTPVVTPVVAIPIVTIPVITIPIVSTPIIVTIPKPVVTIPIVPLPVVTVPIAKAPIETVSPVVTGHDNGKGNNDMNNGTRNKK